MYKRKVLPLVLPAAFLLFFQNCGGFESLSHSSLKFPVADQAGDEDFKKPEPGFDIFVIAGQSNSVGYGGGGFTDGNSSPDVDAKIFQIGRFADRNLKVVPANDRLDHWVSHDAAGNPTVGVGMGAAFARMYVKNAMKPERKVLLIPAGYGGTSSLHWDREIDSIPAEPNFQDGLMLTDDLVARLKLALEQPGGTHVLKGILWHQGESDVDCLEVGIWCNVKTPTGMAYANRIKGILGFIRAQVPYEVPVVVGKLVPVWDGGARPGALARKLEIEDAIVRLASVPERIAVVDTMGLLANSQAGFGSTDNIHFAAQSQIDLGKRYFEALKGILKP